ncbi:MAG TPA: hypothetical protein VMS60_05200 [Solirubrobacterales bacterium]|nr:hypothetical protein [Solirubrobacterales bacterium]
MLDEIWIASIFSGLSAGALCYAMARGLQIAAAEGARERRRMESRARRAAFVSLLLVAVTILLWLVYLRLGPLDFGVGWGD